MRLSAFLLATCAALTPACALAATAPAAPAAAPADADVDADSAIVVVGKGDTRQTQTVTAHDLALMAPGSSPFKAIENLPSVNFQSADPFGAYEWAERISIRGFNQNALGFNLDGVPLGDASYGNDNGLHISRAIATENIGTVQVVQGAGALDSQSTNNLGGTIDYNSADPVDHFAVDASGTLGSFESRRGFIRVNMGVANGPRGYVSYTYSDGDKWKGVGVQKQQMVNAKLVVPVNSGTDVTGYFSYSDRKENDYQDMSLGMIQRLGYNWDNNSGNYAQAVAVARAYQNGTALPAPFQTVDDAYYNAGGLRKDYLGYVGIKSKLSSQITAEAKGYYHQNDGAGLWYTPYVPSANGSAISIRTTEYGIRRAGVFGDVKADMGNNTLVVGGWYENNTFRQARRYYNTASDTVPGYGLLDMPSNPFFTQWQYNYGTDTMQYYVQDTFKLGDLTLNGGWKGFQVIERANAVVPGTLAGGRITSTDWFQPSVGAAYKIGAHGEAFGSFSQSTQAFVAAGTTGPFSTTQAGFAAIQSSLKPQSSDTYEVGYRYGDGMFHGTLGAYWVNFHNRLLGVTSGAGIVGSPTILQNVGGVRSAGIEALLNANLGHGFGATVSYSYNDSTYRNNVVQADGTVVATRGKTVVDAPRNMARAELNYDDTVFFGKVSVDYMSKRYYTYLNDAMVGARALVDATVGYRWKNAYTAKPVELQLNITNLMNAHYVSTIGTNGFTNSGDSQTLMVGAPRAFFGTIKLGF
jgi:iron complex outermembrane receptor protein